jgi:two-component system sensor histidine kinase ChvG
MSAWRERLARGASRLSLRLLAFNVLLVFLPAAGLLYLGTYERQLLELQERSMVQQGRLLASALSGRGDLDAAEAERLLVQLDRRVDARLRVIDAEGRAVVDSSLLGPRREPGDEAPPPEGPRTSLLYRLGTALNRLYRAIRPVPAPPAVEAGLYSAAGPDGRLEGRAVREALAGRYGADVRVGAGPTGRAVTTLHSAIPITDGERVVGAALVSQSTARVLAALAAVRLGIFRVFLASVAAAVVLTLIVATTIARPLRRLSDESRALVDRRGRLRGRFAGSVRRDEIGDLARALAELTRRLQERLHLTESFAADLSHEFKNPLTSIRSAAEMLPEVDDPAEHERFLAVIQRECARLEHLLSAVRDISALDAELEGELGGHGEATVRLGELLAAIVEGYRLRAAADGDRPAAIALAAPAEPLPVAVPAELLSQVAENLIDNAVSFSPPGGAVEVALGRDDGEAVLTVSDHGPGIPPEHLARVFDRFFTYRPGEIDRGDPGAKNGHTGLGLAIARAVVEGCGGSITAGNRPGGGARFTVRLPLAG